MILESLLETTSNQDDVPEVLPWAVRVAAVIDSNRDQEDILGFIEDIYEVCQFEFAKRSLEIKELQIAKEEAEKVLDPNVLSTLIQYENFRLSAGWLEKEQYILDGLSNKLAEIVIKDHSNFMSFYELDPNNTKAIVYLHRKQEDTIENVRIDLASKQAIREVEADSNSSVGEIYSDGTAKREAEDGFNPIVVSTKSSAISTKALINQIVSEILEKYVSIRPSLKYQNGFGEAAEWLPNSGEEAKAVSSTADLIKDPAYQ